MVDTIIKKDGRRQKFSKTKIERAIDKAAREAKVSAAKRKEICKEIANGIVESLKRRKTISASELRTRVLRRLETRSKAAVAAWRRYDRRMKK